MYKEYPYLIDGYYQTLNSQLTKKEFLKKIDELVVNHQYVKITLLDVNENPIKDITGEITGGSLNVAGDSSVRRTSSLSCSVATDVEALTDKSSALKPVERLKEYFSIDKKIFLELGVRNDIDEKPWTAKEYPILWFPQGIFFITDFNISSSSNSAITFSISLKDKMCKLNGFSGGKFPTKAQLDTYYDYGEANEVAERMSKKNIVKGSADDYIMNTKIVNNSSYSDFSWKQNNWSIKDRDFFYLKDMGGSISSDFTIPQNKYLQFEIYVNGESNSTLDFTIKSYTDIIQQDSISAVASEEYDISDYKDLPYEKYIYYLQPGTYNIEFTYTHKESSDSTAEEQIKEFAAIHMLNANQDGGMTFIQEFNGKNPIYNIIGEIVHHFGGEDIDKIIIEDIPVYAKRMIKWDETDESDGNLYMISNIRNNDPILNMGNRIVNMSTDEHPSIPGTNFERKYIVEEDNSLTEYDAQPEETANNLMLATEEDMRRILLSKWAQSLINNKTVVNFNIADEENFKVIYDLNTDYAEYTTLTGKQIEEHFEYIFNNGLLGSKALTLSSFGGYKPMVDIDTSSYNAYLNNTDFSTVHPELAHDGRTFYIDKNEYLFTMTNNTIYFYKFKDEDYNLDSEYNIERYEANDDIGYHQTYLYYDGDLIANTGETVVSILDKIVEKLGGNYEYYYDVFGSFHFREQKNYLYSSFSTAMVKDMETANSFLIDSGIYYLTDTYQSENVYTFTDKNNITSLTNNQNYSNIKNDFVVNNTGASSLEYYHIAIDEKPQINEDGYENVLVYEDPMAEGTADVRDLQYDLAYPIFIDSPNGPQGVGSSDIYGYLNDDDSIKIKLNEINASKDYSSKITIDENPRENGKEVEDDESENDEKGDLDFGKEEDFFYTLTFLQILFTTGGDQKYHKYVEDGSVNKNILGALLYYLYNITTNGNNITHLHHSEAKKEISNNKILQGSIGSSKTIFKSDLASIKKDDLKYDATFLPSENSSYSQIASAFNSGVGKRFTGYKSQYNALGKTSGARKKKAASLINKILYDNYLFNGVDGETLSWTTPNTPIAESSFIALYNNLIGNMVTAYESVEQGLDARSNGKANKSDAFYTKTLEKYITGLISQRTWFGSTDPKIREKKKKEFIQRKKKARKKKRAKTPTNKRINALAEEYVKKHTKGKNIYRFKDKRKKSYSSIITALYNTLVKLYKLTKAKGSSNPVALDDKYYYSSKNEATRKKNAAKIRKLLYLFWNQVPGMTKKTKQKNKKFKKLMEQNKAHSYKYISNFYGSHMNVLTQTITLNRYQQDVIDIPGDADSLIDKAKEHLGCHEISGGKVKDVKSHKSEYICDCNLPWCARFVSHVFKEAGLLNKLGLPDTWAVADFTNCKNYHSGGYKYKPKKGDIVCFNWHDGGMSTDHIGIVIRDGGSKIYTIEGNTSGGRVALRERDKSFVLGYVENKLPSKKEITKYKKTSETVTYSLFSLFRKTFYNELNNVVYKYKKPKRCDFLRHKMRQYFDILYKKEYAKNKKNIYTKCQSIGEYNALQKITTPNDTPQVDKDSSISIKNDDDGNSIFSLNLSYISGNSWEEWIGSTYNTNGVVAKTITSDSLQNKYVFLTYNKKEYWLGDKNGDIIKASDDINSSIVYKWYDLSTNAPKQEASSSAGMAAPKLSYNYYNCVYKGIQTAKFWYYNTSTDSWEELTNWVCYYNKDENKRYVNIDFAATETNPYTGIINPKYLPNFSFMKQNAVWDEDKNQYTYTYAYNKPSEKINSSWYKDISAASRSPLKIDKCEYDISSDDNRLNLSVYIAKEWRTEIILQGLLSYEQNSIEASYYYPELKAMWPTTYNLKNQCFYGQEEDNDLYHTSLTTGNYFLDLIDPNETAMGELSVSAIGRRQDITNNQSVNCLFSPEPHEYYFLNSAAIDYFEQRNRLIDEGLTFITVAPDLWDKYFTIGNTKLAAYDIIRTKFTEGTNYQNSVSISSIPVLYLEPNIRVSIEDSTTNTFGDYIINSFSINFNGTPSMSSSCTKATKKY